MQIRQSRDRHSQPTHLHGGAGSSIEHPCRHDRDDARSYLDMKDLTARPLLTVVPPKTAPAHWMPPIADDNLIPDMGRMTP